jgi:hypothetical protein
MFGLLEYKKRRDILLREEKRGGRGDDKSNKAVTAVGIRTLE